MIGTVKAVEMERGGGGGGGGGGGKERGSRDEIGSVRFRGENGKDE